MLEKTSIIFNFDTRVKILFVLIFTVLIFYVDKLLICVALLFSILLLRIIYKIPIGNIKPLVAISLLVFFSQLLFASGENYIIKPFFGISLKWEGLFMGLTIVCRLVALLFLLPTLTETSTPYEIARALANFGVNYRAAYVITTAFNLIPLFREEGRAIMDAQKLRGCDYFEDGRSSEQRSKEQRSKEQRSKEQRSKEQRSKERRSFKPRFFSKIKAYPSLVIPLVLGAMRKAQSASVAMDSRAFGAYKTRTWLEKPVMKTGDYLFLAVVFIFSVLALYGNYILL